MKKILILYRELAGYFVQCVNTLCESYDVYADIVAYPVNPDAPFSFEFHKNIRLINRHVLDEQSINQLADDRTYQMIFCGGWADKSYLNLVSRSTSKVKLLGFDNQWSGSLKQLLASKYARIKITPLFDVAFVPGPGQVKFANKIGFKNSQILTGAYSCDVQKFQSINISPKSPKKLYFVGRYAPEKFITELCEAMIDIYENTNKEWQLHCAGTGPLWPNRVQHPAIVHHGFMQPENLLSFMEKGQAFILPSTFEPWGVVVHEFACSGYPMILSDEVGARFAFLRENENGYLFRAGEKEDMKKQMIRLMHNSDEQLMQMGAQSKRLSSSITPNTWADSLHQLISK